MPPIFICHKKRYPQKLKNIKIDILEINAVRTGKNHFCEHSCVKLQNKIQYKGVFPGNTMQKAKKCYPQKDVILKKSILYML